MLDERAGHGTSQTPHKRVGRACWPVLYISWYLTNVLDVLLSAAEEELPGVLALHQLRPAHHDELAQRPLRLCPQSAPEEHATARAHQHAVVRRACGGCGGHAAGASRRRRGGIEQCYI